MMPVMSRPESGVDYWYRNKATGAEAYANLDQDHLTIPDGEERVYGGPRFTDS